jgi:hypothetical protein
MTKNQKVNVPFKDLDILKSDAKVVSNKDPKLMKFILEKEFLGCLKIY